jgi:thioredoxin-dependent peroxiredoxin
MPETGRAAPAFTLPNAVGKKISLKDFRGRNVVIYFYPKDSTPGCTQEACDFRDNFARITAMGAVVLGISADGPASHEKFRAAYELPFELLCDEKREVIGKYGVWQEKTMYGRKSMGLVRSTFIVDKNGKLVKQFPSVKVKGHVDAVIKELSALD